MKTTTLYLALFLLSFSGCKNKQPTPIEPQSEFIEIRKEQFQSEKMAFCTPLQMSFENSLHVTGEIVPDINSLAQVSAPIEGMIKKTYVQLGQYVKQGDVILEISGLALINLQQDFATSAAKIKQLKSNYNRTKQLYKDKIKTENENMLAESAYKAELANYSALKLKLEGIGLKIQAIKDGGFASSYQIKAPIEGQVSKMNTILGQFISPQQAIAEIINTTSVQIQLAVFERDFLKIKTGQKVYFNTAGQQNQYATITRIGKRLNPTSKSFDCFATIDTSNNNLIINQLVRGKILMASDSVWAIPQDAITTIGQSHYVYVKVKESEDKFYLSKLKVKMGRSSHGHVELIDIPQDQLILISDRE